MRFFIADIVEQDCSRSFEADNQGMLEVIEEQMKVLIQDLEDMD